MKPILRASTYHLAKRVPTRYRSVEDRSRVWISLKTDSFAEACRRAESAWQEQLTAWELLLKGDTTEAQARFDAARDIAQAARFRYMTVDRVAELPARDLVDRLVATKDGKGEPNVRKAEAYLGTVPKPKINVTGALEEFWGLAADRVLGKNRDQVRRWRNPRKKAVRNFIDVAGDLALDEITADDMQDFVEWWLVRVQAGKVTPNSANKDLTHLSDVLTTVNKKKRLGLDLPVRGWNLREGEKRTRPSFSTRWITDKLLAPGALSGLNPDARGLLLAMVNTGARPSELACLTSEQIRLDAEIPHVSIEPVGRTLKSQYARREIPLLGVSLDAFREFPEGFKRYSTSAGPTDTINHYLRDHGLREKPETTVYSLRHSFQDRMIAHQVDDRLRRDIFGHSLTEERYGAPGLDVKRDALLPVAICCQSASKFDPLSASNNDPLELG